MGKFLRSSGPLILLAGGLLLLLYPLLSDWRHESTLSQTADTYAAAVAAMGDGQYAAVLEAARDYNRTGGENPYADLLNIGGTGIMGFVEIPAADVFLPVYHGTEEAVLRKGAGHLEWSSLPVGGPGSHCVITGHSGLPEARLFTGLHRLKPGDRFCLRILEEVLAYEVEQILVVEPEETAALDRETDRDLCTLVTCTPWGINSHRLLVRGRRAEDADL